MSLFPLESVWFQCLSLFGSFVSLIRIKSIEQSYGLCGRGRGWDDLGEWHWNTYKYHIWNESPVQVRCMILDAWGWCTGMTQRDGMGREEGSGWGTHVYLWRIHFDIWQNQYNIVKLKNKKKWKKKAKKNKLSIINDLIENWQFVQSLSHVWLLNKHNPSSGSGIHMAPLHTHLRNITRGLQVSLDILENNSWTINKRKAGLNQDISSIWLRRESDSKEIMMINGDSNTLQ